MHSRLNLFSNLSVSAKITCKTTNNFHGLTFHLLLQFDFNSIGENLIRREHIDKKVY